MPPSVIEERQMGTVKATVVELPEIQRHSLVLADRYGINATLTGVWKPTAAAIEQAVERHVCISQSITRRN